MTRTAGQPVFERTPTRLQAPAPIETQQGNLQHTDRRARPPPTWSATESPSVRSAPEAFPDGMQVAWTNPPKLDRAIHLRGVHDPHLVGHAALHPRSLGRAKRREPALTSLDPAVAGEELPGQPAGREEPSLHQHRTARPRPQLGGNKRARAGIRRVQPCPFIHCAEERSRLRRRVSPQRSEYQTTCKAILLFKMLQDGFENVGFHRDAPLDACHGPS